MICAARRLGNRENVAVMIGGRPVLSLSSAIEYSYMLLACKNWYKSAQIQMNSSGLAPIGSAAYAASLKGDAQKQMQTDGFLSTRHTSFARAKSNSILLSAWFSLSERCFFFIAESYLL